MSLTEMLQHSEFLPFKTNSKGKMCAGESEIASVMQSSTRMEEAEFALHDNVCRDRPPMYLCVYNIYGCVVLVVVAAEFNQINGSNNRIERSSTKQDKIGLLRTT